MAKEQGRDEPNPRGPILEEDTEVRLLTNMAMGCTVRFDEWSGCGVNVQRHEEQGRVYVELSFLTKTGIEQSHYLTGWQTEQMRAALDAVTRTNPPPLGTDWAPDEPKLRVVNTARPKAKANADAGDQG